MALSIAGKQITAARALADLTVAELAERAGLSRDAIMKIEKGCWIHEAFINQRQ